jgi:hypothetical protein
MRGIAMLISPPRLIISARQVGKTQRLEIENRGSDPLFVTARLESMTQGPTGAALPGAKTPYSAATWVTVVPRQFEVKPHTRRYIQVRIHLPAKPEPGDHNVAIILMLPPQPGHGNIHVADGIGVPTLITVPGPVIDHVSVRSLVAPDMSAWGPVKIAATVSESGDVHHSFVGRHGRLQARADGLTVPFPAITVLRGSTVTLATTWANHPLFCVCSITTAVVADGHRSSAVVTVLILPLIQILIAVGALLAILLAFVLYRRRRASMLASK